MSSNKSLPLGKGEPLPTRYSKVTLLYEGHYYRATVHHKKPLAIAARQYGIVEVGKNYPIARFKALLTQGRLQEISREQALRLLNLPQEAQQAMPSTPTKPKTKAPKHLGKLVQIWLEPEVVDGVRALAERQAKPASVLYREWIRLGYALALDKEKN